MNRGDDLRTEFSKLLDRPDRTASCPLFHQNVTPAIRHGDYDIHYQHHQVVVPPVSVLAPKSRVPHGDFLLNGAEHEENQTKCRNLLQNAEYGT